MQHGFCSHCGAPLGKFKPYEQQRCAACGTIHYHNTKPCAGVLVIQDGKVLLARRAAEPFKGFWDIPGGFLEAGEHPEAGAKRELLEETGLKVRLNGLLGMYLDRYGEAGYYTLNIYYTGAVVSGTPRAKDDVAALEWFGFDTLPKAFAFEHEYLVMKDLKQKFKVRP